MLVPNKGPLCLVVSGNHGSLVDAMLFLQGTPLLERSVLLLPSQLYATHRDGLGVRVCEYRSINDLEQWIDAEQPSLVFFTSGYLLTTTGLVTASQLKRLLQTLERRRCLVMTNDPCWGLLASRVPMMSGLPARTLIERIHRRWVEWLVPRRLRQSHQMLRNVIHCYPVPVDSTVSASAHRTVGYFNSGLLDSLDSSATAQKGIEWARPMDQPYWLFILATPDYDIQVGIHGKTGFIKSVATLLSRANEAGRHAVLIAPEDCLSAVRQSDALGGATLVGVCDYHRYVCLLLFAEYAFYWNVGSSSSLYRLFNSLPVFFFDRGHVSRWFQSFFELTVEILYRGHVPTLLDHREPLDPARLEVLARDYRESANEIVRQLSRWPEPEEMIEELRRQEPSLSGHP